MMDKKQFVSYLLELRSRIVFRVLLNIYDGMDPGTCLRK